MANAEIIGVRSVVKRCAVEQRHRLADAHVEQDVDTLDDGLAPRRIGRLDPDQLHAGDIARGGRHHQELAAAGPGLHTVDVRRRIRETGAQRIERRWQGDQAEQLVGVDVRQGVLHQSDHDRPATVRACPTDLRTTAVVAGVDSSTQSTKVEVRDLDTGDVVGRGSAPHPATTPPRSEQDPRAWWSAFETAWAAAGSPQVEAISVAGQQHGMVVLDADRQVIRPAKLWNDTETAPDAGWLIKQLPGGAAAWAEAVGSVPVASFTITKLSWLHRSEPDNWARSRQVVLPHDWMTMRLTGEFVTDRGDASGTGYWSPASGEYRWDVLSIVDKDRDWSNALPRVAGPTEVVGAVERSEGRLRNRRQHGCGARAGSATRRRRAVLGYFGHCVHGQ